MAGKVDSLEFARHENGMRMLLVDDDAMSRELLTMLLEGEGYVVEAAESGEAALARLEAMDAPELVLTDMQMPGISGAAFAGALRERCGASLIAMSGSVPTAEALRGYDGFLRKPFGVEALAEILLQAKAVAQDGTAGGSADSCNVTQVDAEDEGPLGVEEGGAELDEEVFARLKASMPLARLRELYELCLDDATQRIQRMRADLSAEDDIKFRSGAHAIKGGCGLIGATSLKALAARMEDEGIVAGNPEVTATLDGFLVTCDRLRSMLLKRWADN